MKLIAKEKFYYAGRNVEAGEEFEAEPNDVALLTHSVSPRAKLPTSESAATPAASSGLFERKDEQAVEASQPASRSGRYKRRDMRAKE